MKLLFENVGREKRSFELEVSDVDVLFQDAFISRVRVAGGLVSQDVVVDLEAGKVFVGGFRPVGDVKLVEETDG